MDPVDGLNCKVLELQSLSRWGQRWTGVDSPEAALACRRDQWMTSGPRALFRLAAARTAHASMLGGSGSVDPQL